MTKQALPLRRVRRSPPKVEGKAAARDGLPLRIRPQRKKRRGPCFEIRTSPQLALPPRYVGGSDSDYSDDAVVSGESSRPPVSDARVAAWRARATLRAALSQWQRFVLERRSEWRLEVRARMHSKYALLHLSWSVWKVFVRTCQHDAALCRTADCHYGRSVIARCFGALKSHVHIQREERALLNAACDSYKKALLVRAFGRWKEAFDAEVDERGEVARAVVALGDRVKARVMSRWRGRMDVAKHQKGLERRARAHHNMTLAHCALSSWCAFVLQARAIARAKDAADRTYQHALARDAMRAWMHKMHAVAVSRAHEEAAQRLYSTRLVGSSFCAWRQNAREDAAFRARQVAAERVHVRSLKRRGLIAFARHRRHALRARECRDQAIDWKRRRVLRGCWKEWTQRLDAVEDARAAPAYARSRRYRARALKRTAVRRWKEHTDRCLLRKERVKEADGFMKARVLQRYTAVWRAAWARLSSRRAQERSADEFRRDQTAWKWLSRWRGATVSHRRERGKCALATEYSDRQVLRRVLAAWLYNVQVLREERVKEGVAVGHYKARLQRGALRCLKAAAEDAILEEEHLRLAARHWYTRTLARALERWEEFISSCVEDHRRMARGAQHRSHVLTREAINKWKDYVVEVGKEREASARAASLWRVLVLRRSMHTWRRHACAHQKDREDTAKGAELWQRTTKARVLASWLSFTSVQSARTALVRVRLLAFAKRRKREVARGVFAGWRDVFKRDVRQRIDEARAARMHAERLARGAWRKWRTSCARMRALTAERRSADMHAGTWCMARAWRQWTRHCAARAQMHAKDATALMFWACNLQHRLLSRWKVWTKNAQELARREALARRVRRHRLQGSGAILWLRAAAVHRASLWKLSIEKVVAGDLRVFHCAQRCAHRWLARTRRAARLQHRVSHVLAGTPEEEREMVTASTPVERRRMLLLRRFALPWLREALRMRARAKLAAAEERERRTRTMLWSGLRCGLRWKRRARALSARRAVPPARPRKARPKPDGPTLLFDRPAFAGTGTSTRLPSPPRRAFRAPPRIPAWDVMRMDLPSKPLLYRLPSQTSGTPRGPQPLGPSTLDPPPVVPPSPPAARANNNPRSNPPSSSSTPPGPRPLDPPEVPALASPPAPRAGLEARREGVPGHDAHAPRGVGRERGLQQPRGKHGALPCDLTAQLYDPPHKENVANRSNPGRASERRRLEVRVRMLCADVEHAKEEQAKCKAEYLRLEQQVKKWDNTADDPLVQSAVNELHDRMLTLRERVRIIVAEKNAKKSEVSSLAQRIEAM